MKFNESFCWGLATFGLMSCLGTQPAFATVNVNVQPDTQVALVGSNATITADATATAGEVITGYSWQMSTNGLNPFITVGSNAVLTLTNVQTSDTGFYFVRVTYMSGTSPGTAVSTSVTLTVQDQARITVQPQGLIRAVGTNASFSVTALGLPPPTYQWRYNGTNLTNGGRVSGAGWTNLTIASLLTTDSGNYDVVVSNLYAVVTSQVATLTVLIPPAIGVDPQSAMIVSGSNATFSVTASGSALAFRWRKGATNLSNGGRISGVTSNTMTITGALTNDNGKYSVFISNAVGSVTSADATLTVFIPPTFTSATNATGRQGAFFSYTTTATGTPPITFGAAGLPTGLSIEPTNGLISGIPAVLGVFAVTLFAIDPVITNTRQLVITLATGVPGITSVLTANGQQGQFFSYTILASNNPGSFSASGLPPGLSLNPTSGVISGPPIVSGSFPVTIGAANQYGQDSKTLTLNLASALPGITSPLTASGTENQSGFSYTITASNSPTLFGASGLPLGLTINTNTGAITGTPLYGGTFNVLVSAVNAYGTGSATLVLTVNFATVSGLAITGVTNVFSTPYLLDFSFSLRDSSDPTSNGPVVRPPSQMQVVCMEDGVPIPGETALIVDQGNKKQMKMFLALDYTYSMFASPGAIDAMQSAAKTLINTEPAHAQFGIYEFHADYVAPQLVTTNGLTANKAALSGLIDGIQTNYVQGNYAGTRCWDAIYAALGQFGPFTQTNRDEQRYLVVMSDGNDDSSLLNTNVDPIATMVALAQTNQVRIYCVAFGPNINTTNLQQLTSQTLGQYYEAATTADLALQFMKITKDIDGQYLLRWATLKRTPLPFQPSFQITLDGFTATFNTTLLYGTNVVVDTNTMPATTNITVTNIISLPYNPATYAGDIKVGAMLLVADSDVGPQTIRLRASYVPRYVREIRVNYRPNYPCTASMSSSGPGEFLNGWSMTETNDGTGLRTLTLLSPDPTNLLTSIPYGIMGELATFNFQHPDLLTSTQAFSVFAVDNSVYTNMLPNGQSFVLQNGANFITSYPPPPPHGTPIPWLIAYGFTNNFAAAELTDPNGNGLAVWQDYLAGLNPLDPNSKFAVHMAGALPLGQPQIIFSTVVGRTYRLESATSLDSWTVLRDNISGTGGNVSFTDLRDLSGVSAVFYRVAVY
jgi:Immunoglobulin domain/von Willebrand factor type A domain/Putative Ig domain/Immunoglobulin I-set domain